MHTITLLFQPFLSVQFSGIKYIYIVLQPSLPSISRTFSSMPFCLCALSEVHICVFMLCIHMCIFRIHMKTIEWEWDCMPELLSFFLLSTILIFHALWFCPSFCLGNLMKCWENWHFLKIFSSIITFWLEIIIVKLTSQIKPHPPWLIFILFSF